jgi:hypothetical protein
MLSGKLPVMLSPVFEVALALLLVLPRILVFVLNTSLLPALLMLALKFHLLTLPVPTLQVAMIIFLVTRGISPSADTRW